MGRMLTAVGIAAALAIGGTAAAAERTVTLAVANMTCAACPYIVKRTMAAVPGVLNVAVSYRERRAVVTFDDARTSLDAIIRASAGVGYPARPVEEGS